METLETVKLDKQQQLARYRLRPDAKPHIIKKMEEQIKALDNCVDLNNSKVDNQLLITLRDTIYKAMYYDRPADALIIGIRLTKAPEIKVIDLADMIRTPLLGEEQLGLWEALEIERCEWEDIAIGAGRKARVNKFNFGHIIDGLNYKV